MTRTPIEVRTSGPTLLCLAVEALVATVSPIYLDDAATDHATAMGSNGAARRRTLPAGYSPVVVLLVGENWQSRVAAESRSQRRGTSAGPSENGTPRYALIADGSRVDFYGARKMAVNAFVGTDEPISVLVQAIQSAALNRLYCSPQLLPALIDAVGAGGASEPGETQPAPSPNGAALAGGEAPAAQAALLSSREHQVALHAARGLSNEQVAVFLGISVPTVKFHLMHAFRKLGIQRRTQLYAFMPFFTSATEALLPPVVE